MKILCIDDEGMGLDWLMRCQRAGHEIAWYIRPEKGGKENYTGVGIVKNRIKDLEDVRKRWLGWADLIFVTDNAHYMDLLDPYRKMGYPILAPSPEARDLELDRAKGQAAMKAAGLKIIPSVEFNDYDAASAFVKKNPQYLVSKPSGDANKALSYVAHDAADLIYMLGRWKKNEKYRSDAKQYGFLLQEKKTGCEIAVGGWFGPGGWSKWFYENFEFKKLFPGDLGPNTGELGTLSMYVRKSKLADVALKPIEKRLRELDYCGFIDIAGMVDEKGQFWPFEYTVRPGWPSFHNHVAHSEGDPAQWMVDLLNGKDTLQVRENEACISLVMAIPDWPYSHITQKEIVGIPIYNATDMEHVHLSFAMLGEAPVQINGKVMDMPCYLTAGDYVMVVTGCGDTITGARRSAYSAIKKVKMPASPFWRTDIGRGRLIEELPMVQKHGFATNFKVM